MPREGRPLLQKGVEKADQPGHPADKRREDAGQVFEVLSQHSSSQPQVR